MSPIIQTNKQLRPRDTQDHYPTPFAFASAGVNLYPVNMTRHTNALDIGAGSGVYGLALKELHPNTTITGIDIRDVDKPDWYDNWFPMTDVQKLNPIRQYDLVIGNPPYRIAEECVRFALNSVKPHGYVIMLLRLAFLEGQKRGKGLWKDFPPERVVVLSGRPSFTGNGKTDATAYSYFVWREGFRGFPVLDWTDTPRVSRA